jgi:hypothetical protein
MSIVVLIAGKVKPAGAKGHYYTHRFYEYNLNRIDEYTSRKCWSIQPAIGARKAPQ